MQLNMQAVFLISSKGFSEKQIGVLFLVFSLSQFLCMAPAGYFLDYSHHKLEWVSAASIACAALTVVTPMTADVDYFGWMIVGKALQGAISAILTPGFNGITLGIVGATGFTHQVSRNRMMNHIGTALIVATGTLIAYGLYPNIGALFVVSPLAAFGVWWHLRQILPNHVHRDAARGLIIESPTMSEYEFADDVAICKQQAARVGTTTPAPSWDRSSSDWQPSGMYCSGSNALTPNSGSEVPTPPPSEIAGPRAQQSSGADMSLSGISRGVHRTNSAGNSDFSSAPTTIHENLNAYRPPDLLAGGLDPPSMGQQSGVRVRSVDSPLADPRQIDRQTSDDELYRTGSREESKSSSNSYSSMPSFSFGWRRKLKVGNEPSKNPRTPLAVLLNPTLLVFTAVIFFFHLANSSVLPLVMQSLALRDVQSGILMSGLCILIAQGFMTFWAKLCGDYSPYWGRKNLILVGLVSLTLRCFLLTLLVSAEENVETERGSHVIKALILSTQILDAVGAGIMGTMQILVTSDLSGGTGRFSLILGFTTAAMCLGATVAGYLGQAIAQDYGYPVAFTVLGLISLIPFVLYVFFMPETLPDYARPKPRKRRRRLRELLKRLNDSRRQMLQSKHNPFRRRPHKKDKNPEVDSSPLAKAGHHVELV
jgi:MFS family permease